MDVAPPSGGPPACQIPLRVCYLLSMAAEQNHNLKDRVARMHSWERRVLDHFLSRTPLSRNPNVVFDEQLTLGQRAADHIASFGGSWIFISLFAVVLCVWMFYNSRTGQPFDPYPFILLNLVLSCLAAIQAPVIMMSQNRQEVKDRLDAQHDFEVNLRTELEVLSIHTKLDDLREQRLSEVRDLLAKQVTLLERMDSGINRLLEQSSGS